MDQRSLLALENGDKVVEVHDPRTPGLLLRLQPKPSTVKTFYLVVDRRRRIKVGRFPSVTLAMAREEAPRILARIARGEDPRPEWLPKRPAPGAATTIEDLIKGYSKAFRHLKASQRQSERSLEVLTSALRGMEHTLASRFDARRWRDGLLMPHTKKQVQVKGRWHDLDQLATRKRLRSLPIEATRQIEVPGNRAGTANRKFTAVRSMFRWAVEEGHVASNPCDGIKPLKAGHSDAEVRALTEEQEARLRAALANHPNIDARWKVAFNTGVRLSELTRIRASDVVDGQLVVRRSKTGRSRRIPLNDEARTAIQLAPFHGEFKRSWNTVRREAQISLTWNECTRHTFATRLLSRGVSAHVVARLLGHTTTRMLEVYGHLLPGDAVKAVSLLS